jgi:SAM-dependent methyltransferase
VLTVDYDRLDLRPGMTVLDLGCGEGRHAFEAYRRGASVVAVDWGAAEVATTKQWLGAIAAAGEAGRAGDGTAGRAGDGTAARYEVVRGDLTALPFPDASVDRVMASEVLEHIPDDVTAMAEIARVLRPGGRVAVTVPRFGPERICWALSDEYHANEGGHIRIYRADVLRTRLASVGLVPGGSHHAHALHAPFWWLKCAVGVDRDAAVVRAYHRLLVWDLMKRPWPTRAAERLLDPLMGKSLVVYADKPAAARAVPAAGAGGGAPSEWERTAAAR